MIEQSYTNKIQQMQTDTEEKHKRFHIPNTPKLKENLKVQRSRYMKKYGETIKRDELAALLLETAVLK